MVTKKESSFISREAIIQILVVCFLSCALFISCKTEDPQTTDNRNKTEKVTTKKQDKAKKKPSTKEASNSKTDEYWSGLQLSLIHI